MIRGIIAKTSSPPAIFKLTFYLHRSPKIETFYLLRAESALIGEYNFDGEPMRLCSKTI